ncbi:uncharacterized protein LOC114960219 [Acropora millepora]|uniref:uncharacterized protein LOC114960219 n=1 Tax=Acropora millepora TaxID=45264 RepID=UPI001CF48DED|nr:uncharacterized protein LOC114960219 [Acropora millepora]XP_029194367.2 uncharacterized protein LOC114960219 [Acropora millepora]XP_029194374.2 uncharacterized protein LOC114960219 [Acropora millepora]XP_029194382.2 uncharacterized protein LOC114960219 [Acropora millepora]
MSLKEGMLLVVFVAILASAISSPSRLPRKDLLLKESIREAPKKESIRTFDEASDETSERKYKREEWCDLVYQPCSDSFVAANCIAENECDGVELGCDGPNGECGPADSLQYR